MEIKKNEIIQYRHKKGIQWVKILSIHYDDLEPYYTILLPDGTEKQTISKYLFQIKKKFEIFKI